MATVLGAGLVAVDHLFLTRKAVARVGHEEYLGSAGGGSVGNTLAVLSILGHRSAVTGVVGQDYAAALVRSEFSHMGIQSNHLTHKGGSRDVKRTRQFSHIVYPDGRHSFRDMCLACGRPFEREIGLLVSDIDDDIRAAARRAEFIHVDRANGFTITLVEEASARGAKVSFDYGFSSFGQGQRNAENLLSKAHLVKINSELFKRVTGSGDSEGLRKWRQLYPSTLHLAVTRGAAGMFGFSQIGNERVSFELPGIRCQPFRDSGGAGDVLVAGLVDRLMMSDTPSGQVELIQRLNQAQALASLSCTLYGARSLARVLRDEGLDRGQIWELAAAVLDAGEARGRWAARIGIPHHQALSFGFTPTDACIVCGRSRGSKKRSARATNRPPYHINLGNAPGVMPEAYSIGKSQRAALKPLLTKPSLFVGSGGSLSAAVYGQSLSWHQQGKPAAAMPPYEFIRLPRIDNDVVIWLLSYGGKNVDILGAAEHAVQLRARQVIVITGAKGSPLVNLAKEKGWTCVLLPGQERGFVATSGMLAMVSMLTGLLSEESEIQQLDDFFDYPQMLQLFVKIDAVVREKAKSFLDPPDSVHLIGLSSGWGLPALIDLESKLVEGGVCTVETSELKNFTHGRYIGALERRRKNKLLILRNPENAELADFIERKFWRHVDTLTLSVERPGPAGGVELFVEALFFAAHLAKRAGKDISNPKYPPEARGLYDWVPSSKRTKARVSAIGGKANAGGINRLLAIDNT